MPKFIIPGACFVLLAISLSILSKSSPIDSIFINSLAVVASIRVVAYAREEIAVDLAKVLPLALLGVYLVDPTSFSRELIISRSMEFASALETILPTIVFIIALEWVLRILLGIKNLIFPTYE